MSGTLAVCERWRRIADSLDFAFQPIVDVHSGVCVGYEALLRGWREAGFLSIHDVFDRAHDELVLYRLDLWLREKAIAKFAEVPRAAPDSGVRLFYNLDNRVLEMPDYAPGNTSEMLSRHGMTEESLCFEVSERHEFGSYAQAREVLARYRSQSYTIALDDYGVGYSGLQMLYHCEPGFMKIDRFFIAGMEADVKKRVIVSNVINMAHTFGVIVVGEGVETEQEFRACRELGCDLVQGYLIQSPTVHVVDLLPAYAVAPHAGGPSCAYSSNAERCLLEWIDPTALPSDPGSPWVFSGRELFERS